MTVMPGNVFISHTAVCGGFTVTVRLAGSASYP